MITIRRRCCTIHWLEFKNLWSTRWRNDI